MKTSFHSLVLPALLACTPVLLHAQPGTLDPTFGDNGVASLDLGDEEFGEVMALQPDGKIVVAGYTQVSAFGWDLLVTRFNGDGSLDTDFGTSGAIIADLGGGF